MSDSAISTYADDPRGRGFRSRVTVEHVHSLIDQDVQRIHSESVDITSAAGRILANDVVSDTAVPHFARAAMDGFAVIAAETFGADSYTPASFSLIGRSRPGQRFDETLRSGQAVAIATGAPLPAGADAVVPVESTAIDNGRVLVNESVTPGRHVGRVGEDVEPGRMLLQAGRVLRPQDLGLLSGIGIGRLEVVALPGVYVLITGDELLPPGQKPQGVSIPDMNWPMLAALVQRDGGRAILAGRLPDDPAGLRSAIAALIASPESHAVLISGGSSTGPEDHAPAIVRELGVLRAHGVALRPSSPTGYGLIGGKPVLLLPGNPVSCLCAYDFFGSRVVRRLGGRGVDLPYPARRMTLDAKIVSVLGRVDYVRVRRTGTDRIEPIATGGASILSGTVTADGYVVVPAGSEGFAPGTSVDVRLYDNP